MKILIVDEKNSNKKIIDFLQNQYNNLSTSTIYKALRKKDIRINNIRINENCLVRLGDEIKIYIPDDLLENIKKIPIVYQDDNIVVFNKPNNMETTGENSLTSIAKEMFKNNSNTYVEPCHRLDRNTSGIILFSRNKKSEEILLNAFKNHTIKKRYICVVTGIPKDDSKRLEAYLFKDSKKSLVYISDIPKAGYKKIITNYTILKKNYEKNLALLDISIETGRTHQIRAHLAYIGYPILGDGKYGKNKVNSQFKINKQCLASYSVQLTELQGTELSYLNNKNIQLDTLPFSNLV